MTASGMLTRENFWTHLYTKSLSVRGRLALCYVMFFVGDQDQIVLEDMSLICGLDPSECSDWLDYFMESGHLRPEMRWS